MNHLGIGVNDAIVRARIKARRDEASAHRLIARGRKLGGEEADRGNPPRPPDALRHYSDAEAEREQSLIGSLA